MICDRCALTVFSLRREVKTFHCGQSEEFGEHGTRRVP
jgi:hypothetical protein